MPVDERRLQRIGDELDRHARVASGGRERDDYDRCGRESVGLERDAADTHRLRELRSTRR